MSKIKICNMMTIKMTRVHNEDIKCIKIHICECVNWFDFEACPSLSG